MLDVNVLVALLWENHEHHLKARSWFKNVPAFATCPVVQLGFARVSSHPLLGYGMTPEAPLGIRAASTEGSSAPQSACQVGLLESEGRLVGLV